MTTKENFPFFPVTFDKQGRRTNPAQVSELLAYLAGNPVTDLLVMSHGWNNNMADAESLYDRLLKHLRTYAPTDRQFAVLGVFWPSMMFSDKELQASGAASGGSLLSDADLIAQLEQQKGSAGFDLPQADALLTEAQTLVPHLEDRQTARTRYAEIMQALAAGVEPSPETDSDGTEHLRDASAATLLAECAELELDDAADATQTTAGSVSGISDWWASIKGGANTALTLTTFYQMKERAALVGSTGLRGVLAEVKQRQPALRLHLMGHSFGARLVTSALNGQSDFVADSLSLLQAAFSHNGFSADYNGKKTAGFFRPVVNSGRVKGPMLITHTAADFPVGRMYALASRLARQQTSGLGDASDVYGGLGRNGAQHTTEAQADKLLAAPGTYTFAAGRIHNLDANGIITGHGDVARAEVASAIMQAVATT